MARIDIKTLVMAFETRITALEKNPPEMISTHVIINLLEAAVEEEIKNHFHHLIKEEMRLRIQEEYKAIQDSLINKVLEDALRDIELKESLLEMIKNRIVEAFE